MSQVQRTTIRAQPHHLAMLADLRAIWRIKWDTHVIWRAVEEALERETASVARAAACATAKPSRTKRRPIKQS